MERLQCRSLLPITRMYSKFISFFQNFIQRNGFSLQPEPIFVVYKGERLLLQNKEETKVRGFWKGKIAYGRQRDCKAILGSQ